MSALLYLLGLLLGAAIFFYLLSLYHTGVDKLSARRKGTHCRSMEIDPTLMEIVSRQAFPRERICPICKAILTYDDVLYATRVEQPKGAKILIHGCKYCYRAHPEEKA
ncbi:MAG: hypothetical protein N2316_05685 [Spirochaetes bacterium]|nr:hypothetical protein [Spirochaetota bacterium]